jgi:hypothetical protein
MSLDAATGALTYDDGERLDPGTTHSAFVASALGALAQAFDRRETWKRYNVPARTIDGISFSTTITFEGERIFSIELGRARPGRGYEAWSLDTETEVEAADNRWLDAALGEGRRTFPWGSAGAFFEPRSAAAMLNIRYRYDG